MFDRDPGGIGKGAEIAHEGVMVGGSGALELDSRVATNCGGEPGRAT